MRRPTKETRRMPGKETCNHSRPTPRGMEPGPEIHQLLRFGVRTSANGKSPREEEQPDTVTSPAATGRTRRCSKTAAAMESSSPHPRSPSSCRAMPAEKWPSINAEPAACGCRISASLRSPGSKMRSTSASARSSGLRRVQPSSAHTAPCKATPTRPSASRQTTRPTWHSRLARRGSQTLTTAPTGGQASVVGDFSGASASPA
mmetsp:Transcript_9234/g.28793  ORF Transcript_9234/g.28793 Transcript_9234/m.28793 type:complete len:203 (+) Transcript_9234:102-710(+)